MSLLMRLSVLGSAAAALLAAGVSAKVPASALEAAVKASYLTKFGPFVQWPPSAMPPGSPARICVVGADPFGAVIDEAVRGQQVQGHALVVARMGAVDSRAAASCHIMFVGRPTEQPTAATLRAAAGLPVLTVTDSDRGVDSGIIQFVLENGRVRFKVDQAAAETDGLQISAKLLALALEVHR